MILTEKNILLTLSKNVILRIVIMGDKMTFVLNALPIRAEKNHIINEMTIRIIRQSKQPIRRDEKSSSHCPPARLAMQLDRLPWQGDAANARSTPTPPGKS